MIEALWHDVRYALRLLRRSPGFAVTSSLTLALAIGANAAVFSAVRGVLLAPLPYADPDRLVRLFEEAPTTPHFPMAPADFRDYREELRTFEGLAAYVRADLQLGDAARPEQLRGMQVSGGFFRLLGYQPLLGREFTFDDEVPGREEGVILSHGFWMRRFNGDSSIVGGTIRLSGRPFRVVGVLSADVQHVGSTYRSYAHGEPVDVWAVLRVPRDQHPRWRFSHYYNVVGRVRAGVTTAQMDQDLHEIGKRVALRYPAPNSPWKARAVPLKEEIVGSVSSTLLVIAGAAGAVLLLACVNVASLLLGRAVGRSREIAVRAALGATRGRLARQLLIESLVLAGAGGIAGAALAYAAIAALTRFGPADLPRLQMITVDGRLLLYTGAAAVGSALLFGLAPALRLARSGVGAALKDGGRTATGSSHHLRRALAGVELALAFLLVVSSGLLLRSFVSMLSADPGFEPAGAVTASLDLPTARYPTAAAAEVYARAAERVRALPGVRAAAFSSDLPWTGYDENASFDIIGRPPADVRPEARYHSITPGYIGATGTRLIAGRELSPSDVKDAPLVVLINESAARKYWERADAAVGARLKLWGAERTIAGVIGDVRDMPWHARAVPALYFPHAQVHAQPMFLIARGEVEPASLVDPIRRALREIDPELPLANVRPLEAVAGAAVATRRLTLWLVATFGLTSLFLAVVGIYGVIAQAVGERAHEFGVRQALGAMRGDIMRLVFSSAAPIMLGGLAAGLGLALISTRVLASLLYGVSAVDPVTFAAVAIVLAAAACAASYVPARRATKVSGALR